MKHLLLLPLFVNNLSAYACDCLMSPVKTHINTTPYLITGEVIELLDNSTSEGQSHRQWLRLTRQDSSRGYHVRIRVLESFRGEFHAGDTIELKSHYTTCELSFSVGTRAVLFMHKEADALFITHCSYSEYVTNEEHFTDLMKTIYAETRRKRQG
ncbi:hypothetical protein LRS06_04235 [Hymenobacter sp. J193]|uniref:hypothetical protein n=1 Tax=Hymenobacter sp. J193 TaxID=2898429 RepID=UPI002150CC4B|nr:hypothetical protein [Hymenobacter sp. J193]MCR5886997.1 hypothetical protein [Hymenobacter sp. J193]